MSPLILKRASASRSSGQWSDDDYDVLEDGVVVGRISKEPAAPQGRQWGGRAATRRPRSNEPHTVTSRRERPRWQRSLRVGGASNARRRSPQSCARAVLAAAYSCGCTS
jgi:hypothetical protein